MSVILCCLFIVLFLVCDLALCGCLVDLFYLLSGFITFSRFVDCAFWLFVGLFFQFVCICLLFGLFVYLIWAGCLSLVWHWLCCVGLADLVVGFVLP